MSSTASACVLVADDQPDVLAALKLLLKGLVASDATLPVVVMTAWGSIDGAVEAMRRGARDYVPKPWENARLLATLRTQVELATALREARAARTLNARE